MASFEQDILILCKTYPSPSGKYVETSCVAGTDSNGKLIRLYPVPFRLIDGAQQFRKWQWVRARIDRAIGDRRPESHKLFVDTVKFNGPPLSAANEWQARRAPLGMVKVFSDFAALDADRIAYGTTLGLVRPSCVRALEVSAAARPDWTDDERAKLLQSQRQGGLFDDSDAKALTMLRKLPYDFHYHYECEGAHQTYKHKIVDWEAGALFWNCLRRHGNAWQEPFRQKLEVELPTADLMFLMGTIHRFPDQWLIVSLIYPPRQPPSQSDQQLTLSL
ncbi:hypothetical protein J6500_22585 [Bradyrhizobium sp. WSM 1704]|uniref:hypothetical protein n=1 Tax=Bradyrhizobium semiaridum TaxID=2821404 RepID=UPI001CE27784|nr:hypothetical protein [Bradyrhizobium semiaridum]MCA6124657.1 hypothetical protein [Bradyrhizobium semiaridum]